MSLRIDRLDLKQLRVLLTLAQTRNTYRAAEQLHLSQSAVSRALARLRESLDDPVFVRAPGGLQPTALTERLVARLPEVLDLLADAVDESAGFEPVKWTGNLNIALSNHVTHCWGTHIYRVLSRAAPHVNWNFRSWHSGSSGDLVEGRLDMGIHFRNDRWDQSLYQQTVRDDRLVLLARKGHPLAGKPVEAAHFSEFGLVSLLMPDWNDVGNLLESQLIAIGETPEVRLRVESLAMALECLQETDALMAGTQTLADINPGLAPLEYPRAISVPDLPVTLVYPRRLRDSVRYRWLVEEIREALE